MNNDIYTYTSDMTRPNCPTCGVPVEQYTMTPEEPWKGTCSRGHSAIFQLDIEGEWLEDSINGRFSRVTTTAEESTWICNECGEAGADPYDTGCTACGATAETN
ncbi:hypothetical protein EV681_4611 [Advenella incenata]|uniref:Uncharacterized protein n=1 Tax=Advenella incenata TaxID=267800 RepID=A0A4Q7V6V5_9BURK|nr:hypothetical protein [Advenella incenata]RZT91023.1 hypothetical protein EV681_4611 [Advenella incenata]